MPTTTRTHTAIATIAKGVVESVQFPTSNAGPEEVVVKVACSAITAPDVYMVEGVIPIRPENYPVPLGLSISGFVDAVGDRVTRLKEGDRVRSHDCM